MAGRILIVANTALSASISGHAQFVSPITSDRAAELVQELREFPAAIPGVARNRPDVREERRRAVYDELWTLGAAAFPALIRGLTDPDVQVRRNVALFLNAAGGNWYDRRRPRLNIRPCLTAMIAALEDSDARVRALAAQAIGTLGSEAAAAVPALISLLGSADEGSRNSACIGLRGVGPAAKEALPALRKALSDPSADVRHFAGLAIAAIEAR